MKLGLSLPTFTADVGRPLDAARQAAADGFDGVFAVDHLFPPGSPERPSLEPFTLLAGVAAREPGLAVGVLVTRAGFREPGIVAKQASNLHLVSRGRAIVAVGMGDHLVRAEHEMLGVPFLPAEERVAVLEEEVLALRALFAGRAWEGGLHVPAMSGPILPEASPPVWVGGTGERVLGAAARSADAWNGWGLDVEGFRTRAAAVARLAEEAGRDPSEVPPTWGGIVLVGEDRADLERLQAEREAQGPAWAPWSGTAEDLRAFAEALAEAGCAWFVCLAAGPPDRQELIARTLRGR
jgi:alkanesulfonate monooxygenase SsuD/methylene tetrahydromethanopterin reductase-like flavin-dependent oxidoreductase (luciferase family)